MAQEQRLSGVQLSLGRALHFTVSSLALAPCDEGTSNAEGAITGQANPTPQAPVSMIATGLVSALLVLLIRGTVVKGECSCSFCMLVSGHETAFCTVFQSGVLRVASQEHVDVSA